MRSPSISSGIGSACRRWLLPVAFVLSWGWAGAVSPAAVMVAAITPAAPTEYDVKAAYLWRFTQYVDWPPPKFAEATNPIIIGVLGAKSLAEGLEKIAGGQPGKDRPIEIRLLSTVEEAAACHLVFMGKKESRQQPAWLARLGDLPVLTVVETDDGLGQGAVVAFIMEKGGKVRFDVSLPAMQRAGLRISTPMLVSARQVQRTKKGGD